MLPGPGLRAAQVLVEAESFRDPGGWVLDTQFIEIMGSPYLMAHGLGQPVKDASTELELPAAGTYRVFVRTKDWVARWKAPGQPGRFELVINGEPLKTTFGVEGAAWHWQAGGEVRLGAGKVKLALRDLTGFNGRCDAIFLTDEPGVTPPNDKAELGTWRRKVQGLPERAEDRGGYDLVVIGGGYSGMGAAISGARAGLKVALVQNRGVLGGNGSSEVRVWAMGLIRRGKYPRIGEIVEEFADRASKSPGPAEMFEDEKKERIVRAEQNIDLFLHHHAHAVETADREIKAVRAYDTRTGQEKRFLGRFFVDCTGHGTVGELAGAEYDMTEKGHMGMSNMWTWETTDQEVKFPDTPWALNLEMEDFPYPVRGHGEWFWETGFDRHPLLDLEHMRDWNLRAVFGAWNAMKNRGGAAKHTGGRLTWVAHIGGPRESRRLLGDVLLTQEDIVSKRDFPDGCVPSTWSIDLHYPKQQYMKKYPEDPFIAIAKHDKRIDRNFGYPIPYRCLYSRNISNLFMAGRNISVTHEALGTVRVMKTCGMMGEVVGKAASVAVLKGCTPREVYERYWSELDALLVMPGAARRATPQAAWVMPSELPAANPHGPPSGLDPAKLAGVVVDDRQAKFTGSWTEGTGLRGYVGHGYRYSSEADATARFELKIEKPGRYELRYAYQPHENRATQAPIAVRAGGKATDLKVSLREKPTIAEGFASLGVFEAKAAETWVVEVGVKGAGGTVHVDAVHALPVP
jgi:hypothetical protein